MNETKPIDTGVSPIEPVKAAPSKIPPILAKIWAKIPDNIKEILKKFYTNKKIFWPITILFAVMFLIIILGLLFGSPAPVQIPVAKKTPVPFSQANPTASPSGDILTTTELQLNGLNNQINSLDTAQNKLKPPVINYKIDF